jgi:GAF domain-containing protein
MLLDGARVDSMGDWGHMMDADVVDRLMEVLVAPDTDLPDLRAGLTLALRAAGRGDEHDDLWARIVAIRGRTSHRDQRERAMSALFQSAHDLTRLREPEAVLRGIVRRGRDLMQLDCVWMMLRDENDQLLHVRVTDGVTSPKFEALQVASGEGVAGAVLRAGAARWSSDFRVDSRFVRPQMATDATEDEGIRAILGAPLSVDDKVSGVLLAGHRSVREFTPEEIDVFVSLAAHAAVVLENARLFASVSETMDQLRATQTALEEIHQAQVQATTAQDRLLEAAVLGGGLQNLIGTISEILGGTVALTDDAGRTLYDPGTDQDGPTRGERIAWATSLVADDASGAEDSRPSHQVMSLEGAPWAHVVGLWNANELIGYLVLESDGDLTDSQRQLFAWSSLVAALVLVGTRASGDLDKESRSGLLLELVTSGLTERSRLLASSLSLDLSLPATLCVVEVSSEMTRARVYRAARKFSIALGGAATSRDHLVILSVPVSSRALTHLADRLSEAADEKLSIGSSRVEVDVRDGFPRALERANKCQAVLKSLGLSGRVVDADELSPYAILLGSLDASAVASYLRDTVGPVQEYDEQFGTPLLQTLDAVYEAGGQVAAAAERLHIHPNTVYQRLGRIDSISGRHWKNNETAMQWQLALALRRLAKHSSS